MPRYKVGVGVIFEKGDKDFPAALKVLKAALKTDPTYKARFATFLTRNFDVSEITVSGISGVVTDK